MMSFTILRVVLVEFDISECVEVRTYAPRINHR